MTTVVNNGLRVSRIYSWQIAPFHCFCLSHGVFNLVKFVRIPTQKFESQLNGINPFSVRWESSQSERLLYENFIMKENTLFAAENDFFELKTVRALEPSLTTLAWDVTG